MTATTRLILHYLEAIVRKANLNGFDEMRAEIEAVAEADETRVAELEATVAALKRSADFGVRDVQFSGAANHD